MTDETPAMVVFPSLVEVGERRLVSSPGKDPAVTNRPIKLASLLLAAALLTTGCGSSDDVASEESRNTAEVDGLLDDHGLAGLSSKQVIERLDQATDKPQELMASVRYDELQVSDAAEPDQVAALPVEDGFYLSVAPYVDSTHDCYFHSLTTCQGELAGEELDVTITRDDGEVLVDETVTTYANGFVGFWLPRDIEATLEVSYDGREAATDITTGPEDPTCLTTLRLT